MHSSTVESAPIFLSYLDEKVDFTRGTVRNNRNRILNMGLDRSATASLA